MLYLFALFTLINCLATFTASAAPHRKIVKTRRSLDLDQRDIFTFLDAHNTIRARHNANPLTWSPALASKAAFWADLCMFQHSDGILTDHPYGESIVGATGRYTIRDAVGTLAATRKQYDPRTSFSQYTQLIWKSTTEVGCAIAKCDGIVDRPITLYVCVYDPAGNVVGELSENVEV